MMRVGDYELLDELARGGQGVVYRARDATGALVAVKLLTGAWSRDRDCLRRCATEVARLRALRNLGICSITGFGEVEGRRYVVMELLEGLPLSHAIAQSKRESANSGSERPWLAQEPEVRVRQAVRLVEHVARATHAAHEHGVVHCDLKPANVMLTPSGEPVLLDFGLAEFDSDTDSERQLHRGTPAYMAPEQLDRSFGRPGVRTDVHALGALLYEMVLLEPAFGAPTRAEICREVLTKEVRLSDDACRTATPGLAAVIETALALEPGRRYASALALAEDLARIGRGERPRARRSSRLRRFARLARRQRTATTVGVVIFASLLALIASSFSIARDAREMRNELQRFVDREALLALLAREDVDTWPPIPERVASMRAWISEAEALMATRGRHAGQLALLGPSLPDEGEGRRREREELTTFLAQLVSLSARFEAVESRLAEASTLAERTITRYADEWRSTCAALSDPSDCAPYSPFELVPQPGLVPLGRDPVTGLFEFFHPASGRAPDRDAQGRIRMDGDAGIVFVLVPEGRFVMGAERTPRQGANSDAAAAPSEGPCHTVELAPYFLSKFEVTQGQWLRLTGENPSEHQGAWHDLTFTLAHPVESVGWSEADATLRRVGLNLPTEAQWEYAARAGSRTPWSSGASAASLVGHANIADRSHTRRSSEFAGAGFADPCATEALLQHDDGWPHTAPVGSFAPNEFGLHDTLGNVFEHVLEPFQTYDHPTRPGDGARLGGNPEVRVARGGSAASVANRARVSVRFDSTPTLRWICGVRPARAIEAHL